MDFAYPDLSIIQNLITVSGPNFASVLVNGHFTQPVKNFSSNIWEQTLAGPLINHYYYMALSHKDWELQNSRIWLAKIDIDRGLDFPI